MIKPHHKIVLLFSISSFLYLQSNETGTSFAEDNASATLAAQYRQIFSAQPCTPLYAPWRHSYENNEIPKAKLPGCPFCTQIAVNQDEEYFILKRGDYCMIMLNLFPYANGHLLIIPYEHTRNLHELPQEARAEIMEFTTLAWRALQIAYQFVGANIGCNIGPYSGASIPDHLHIHILPRTNGDIGFNELLARTPVITFNLRKTYALLQSTLDELCKQETQIF